MPEKKKFNIGNIVFWLSFSFFFFFILFNIAEDLFDKEGIAEKLFPLPEESPPIDTVFCDKIINRLEWTSYEGRNFKIEYVLCLNDFEDSQNFRNNMTVNNNNIGEYYHAILTQDQMAMKKIVDAYRFIIRSQNLDYMEAAEMIVNIVGKGTIEVKDKDADFPSRGALNIDRAKTILGFDPKVDVEQGFQKYYEWLSNSVYWSSKTV